MVKNLIKFIFFCTLSSCSNFTTLNNSSLNTAFYNLFPNNTKIVQFLTLKKGDKTHKAQVVFIKKEDLKISVLNEMGLELLRLTGNKNILKLSPIIPETKIDLIETAILDMLAVYSEKGLLYKEPIKNFVIEDYDLKRIVKMNQKLFSTIFYDSKDRWKSNVKLQHHILNYEIKIISIDFEKINVH